MGKSCHRWILTGVVAIVVPCMGVVGGCSQEDQPKLADAPAVQPSPPKEQPKIPGQKKAFMDQPGYAKYMSKGGQTK